MQNASTKHWLPAAYIGWYRVDVFAYSSYGSPHQLDQRQASSFNVLFGEVACRTLDENLIKLGTDSPVRTVAMSEW